MGSHLSFLRFAGHHSCAGSQLYKGVDLQLDWLDGAYGFKCLVSSRCDGWTQGVLHPQHGEAKNTGWASPGMGVRHLDLGKLRDELRNVVQDQFAPEKPCKEPGG